MNIMVRVLRRLKAECIWARLGFNTHLVYYKRKPLVEFEPLIRGRQSENVCLQFREILQSEGLAAVSCPISRIIAPFFRPFELSYK